MVKIAFADIYKYTLPANHRFPMIKYELLPQQLLLEGIAETTDFFAPEPLEEKWILRTHDSSYWQKLKKQTLSAKEARKIGFPMTPELVYRGRVIARGTLDCALHALKNKTVALNIAGGTHHAFSDRGEGFCVLNDIAIATNYLLDNCLVDRIMIIDLDVHQGNGTATLFSDIPQVFTFSMHGKKNYPLFKEKSDLDIEMEDATSDDVYLDVLYQTLPDLLDRFDPQFVFYLSGVDVLENDTLGRLSMSIDGCYQRDLFVFESCINRSIPVAVSMGGGYSAKLSDIINAHCNTFRAAFSVFSS